MKTNSHDSRRGGNEPPRPPIAGGGGQFLAAARRTDLSRREGRRYTDGNRLVLALAEVGSADAVSEGVLL